MRSLRRGSELGLLSLDAVNLSEHVELHRIMTISPQIVARTDGAALLREIARNLGLRSQSVGQDSVQTPGQFWVQINKRGEPHRLV